MNRRQALVVLGVALALLAVQGVLLAVLYRGERRALTDSLDERLLALGRTAARAPVDEAFLRGLVADNELDDALIIDGELRVLAGARTPAGGRLNLLRLDPARVTRALAGSPSVARGYTALDVPIESAVFAAGGGALVLEAGVGFYAPAQRLKVTYGAAALVSLLLVALFATGLWLGVRALERARLAHGRAERLAAVGQMAAMVAHEVRNPLGIVRGQVELLRERLPPEAAARERERVEEILAEIERMNRLTQEFLSLARDAPMGSERVDVGALAAEVAHAARAATPDADVAAEGESAEIIGDAGRLRQALLNLVLNAVQVGGNGVRVRLRVEAHARDVEVRVSDDGPGVPAALRATLFEPFVGARPGGSGLGLALAARVAERHGGRLALVPSPRGATFLLTLPREPWVAS